MKRIIMFLLGCLLIGTSAWSQETQNFANEKEAIKTATLDYLEGWYEANPERMEKALHPDLVKRFMVTLPTGKNILNTVSAKTMVEYTRAGGGTKTPKEKQQNNVFILDVSENIATVKAVSYDYIDYLHLAKSEGTWKIINVLWRPNKK